MIKSIVQKRTLFVINGLSKMAKRKIYCWEILFSKTGINDPFDSR